MILDIFEKIMAKEIISINELIVDDHLSYHEGNSCEEDNNTKDSKNLMRL